MTILQFSIGIINKSFKTVERFYIGKKNQKIVLKLRLTKLLSIILLKCLKWIEQFYHTLLHLESYPLFNIDKRNTFIVEKHCCEKKEKILFFRLSFRQNKVNVNLKRGVGKVGVNSMLICKAISQSERAIQINIESKWTNSVPEILEDF